MMELASIIWIVAGWLAWIMVAMRAEDPLTWRDGFFGWPGWILMLFPAAAAGPFLWLVPIFNWDR